MESEAVFFFRGSCALFLLVWGHATDRIDDFCVGLG